jgi:hypothetical protein
LVAYIDLSYEAKDEIRSSQEISSEKAWVASNLKKEDWLIPINEEALFEIKLMIQHMQSYPLPILLRRPDQFNIPRLREIYKKCKNILDNGVGFSVIDKLPIDEFEVDVIIEVYWILGQLIGPNVAQKWDGTMIYDVKDTEKKYGYGVRGSATSVELVFHTDNSFGVKVPDYVGLFCKNHAKSGGLSRFCSLYSVHNRMQRKYPKELARLYQPVYFDRQAEHALREPKLSFAPFFSWSHDKLRCRANTALIKKGYEISGKKMDLSLVHAIEAIDEVTSSPDLWVEAPLSRGEVQYLSNHDLGHYRSDFKDFKDLNKKRHLYRLWHRSEGSISYDGQ